MQPSDNRWIARDRLLRQIRDFFHDKRFVEVNPPCLSRDCVVDAFLDPISVSISEIGLAGLFHDHRFRGVDRYFLQTSPESAMKRMLVMGAPSIFAITPVFRRDESGVRHNLEFMMLEWYEVNGTSESAIAMLGTLARLVFDTPEFQTVTYQDAFMNTLDIDPLACPTRSIAEIVSRVDADLAASIAEDRDGLLDVLLSTFIEPALGVSMPAILTRYPVSQAALARPCDDDLRVAQRFELFYRGVELANGYDELLDADELVRRYQINNEIRIRHGREPLRVETRLVAAMRRGLPRCSGVALGLDRVLMLQTNARCLADVIPLPFDEA